MKTYEVITNELGGQIIKRTDLAGNESWIPLDPANSDYAEYLRYQEWVAAGKKPADFWNQAE